MNSEAVELEQAANAGAKKWWVEGMGGCNEGAGFEEVLEDIQGHSEMPVRRRGTKDADERGKVEKRKQNRFCLRSHQSKLPPLMVFPLPISPHKPTNTRRKFLDLCSSEVDEVSLCV